MDGGSGALTKWQVTQDDGATWSDLSQTDTTLNTVVTGLSDGTSYSFKVRAVNSTGTGLASSSSATAPSAITLSAAGVTHNTATLTLGNHSTAWYYQYTTPTGGSCSAVVGSGTTSANLTGLTGNTSYTFTTYSDSSCTTPLVAVAFLTRPAQPSTPTVGTGAGSGTLRLSATLRGGSGALRKWQYTTDDGATWNDLNHTGNTLNTRVTGLTNATSYSFKVRAVNGAGAGPASAASATVAPSDEALSASNLTHNTATLTLANYTSDWYYQYTLPTGGSCSAVVAAGTTSANLTGLSSGTSYTYKAYGDSGCTTELATANAFLIKPAQVTGLTVTDANASLNLSWTAVTGTVNGYNVQWKSGSDSYNTDTRQQTVTSGSTTTITGLTNATTYTLRVSATNATGDGAPSTEVSATPGLLCERTPAVRDAIVAAVPGKTVCGAITTADLAAINGKLDLRLKGITSLKAGDFDGLSSLTELDLYGNSLSSLPAGIFDPLTALVDLTLGNNSLTTIPAGIFDKLTKLTTLSLYKNGLTSLPSGIFDKLTNLSETLDLGSNQLSSLPDGIFDKLTGFQKSTLFWEDGAPFHKTSIIYLDNNLYTTLPYDILENLTGLKTLWLSYTLTYLPAVPESVSNSLFLFGNSIRYKYAACDAAVTLSRSSVSVGASGSTTYTLVLAAPPNPSATSGNVTITPSSSATDKVTVSPATLTFNTSNWNTPQTVTVSGVATGTATINHSISGGGYGNVVTGSNVTVDSVAVAVIAQDLSVSDVTTTTATLTLADHTGDWYYQYTTPTGGSCSAVVAAGTTTTSLTGLVAGTSYTFNAYSDSSCTTANALTSQTFVTLPDQVTGVRVSGASGSLLVRWSAVTGATGYKVQWKSGSEDYNTSSRQQTVVQTTGSSTTVTGLSNGTSYTVRVRATTAGGDGAVSSEVTASPGATLTASAVKVDTATLTISNHANLIELGYSLDRATGNWYYKQTAPAPAGACSSVILVGVTTASLTGLAGNTSYTFKAYSDSGCTTELTNAAVAAQFLTKPAQPSQPVVSRGAGSGALTLSATLPGGSTPLSKWQYSKDDGATWSDLSTTDTTLNAVVTGLSDGTDYTFKVRAVNSTGTGTASPAAAAASPSAISLTVDGVTHNAASLTLGHHGSTWRYKYTAPGGGLCSAEQSGSSASLTGLAGNTRYTFKVYGDDGCSAVLATAPPFLTKPSQPSPPVVSRGAGSGTLTLSATLSGGSGALSKWQYTTDDGASWNDVSDTDNSLSYTVTGLTNGTSYTFKVRAVNSAGAGPISVASTALSPSDETLSLSGVSHAGATLTIGSYTGNWYTQYTVPTGGSCAAVAAGTSTTSLTGLSSGTSYVFKAYSDSGCITELATATAFLTPPAPVTGVTVTEAAASLRLSWTAETGTVTGYKVQWKSGSDSYNTGTRQQTVTSGTTTAITGLANGTTYTLRVIASNTAGDGDASTEVTATPSTLCERTAAVRDAIVAAVPGKTTCGSITTADLAALTGKLDLKDKKISSLKAGDFDGLSGVETLDLSGNSLNALPAGIFDPLVALKTLDLDNNNLTTIPAGSFDKLTRLTALELLSNQLTTLPSGIFDRLTSLTTLDLGHNRLASLPAGIFDQLSAFTGKLYLDNNSYTTLPATIFAKLSKMTSLSLSNTLTCLLLIPDSAAASNALLLGVASSSLPACDAAVTVSSSSLSMGSSGSQTYTLVLAAPPNRYATSGNVTITAASSATDKATVAPATLTFTTSNWSTPQTVTVSGVAAGSATISHGASGGGYGNVTIASVSAGVTTGHLSISNVAATTATLTLSNHTGDWYYQYTTPSGGSCSAVVSSGTTTTSLTGLAAATSYTFSAYSDSGCTTANALATQTFLTRPGQVSGVVVTDGNAALDVRWSGVSGTVSGYNVQWRAGGDSYNTTTRQHTVANATSTTLTGLANGTTYTVRVIATNATGDGVASTEVTGSPAVATLTASAVESDTATLSIGIHQGSWYYQFTSPTGGSCSAAVDSGTTSASLTRLAGNTRYTFKAYSDSSCTTALAATTAFLTKPGKPSQPVTSAGAGSGTLTLSATLSGGSTPLSKWQYSKDDGASWSDLSTTATTLNAVVTGLSAGTNYSFKVRAVNSTGTGPASAASNTRAASALSLAATGVTHNGATLTLGNHTGDWYYQYTVPTGGSCSAVVSSGTTSASLTSLAAATNYTYKVYSDSGCTTELARAVVLTRPGQVSGVAVTDGNAALDVSWTGVSGTVDGYKVQWRSGNDSYNTTTRQQTVASGTSTTITGLANGITYTVRVAAYNATGDGAASTEVTGTPGLLCGRTPAVRDAIVAAVAGKTVCSSITNADLAAITGTFNLKDKKISSLKAGDFAGLSSVTTLDLATNNLSSLPAGIFDPLTALTTLDLRSNSLTSLPAGSFDELTELQRLQLWENDLTSLPSGIFNQLTKLEYLGLWENDLTSLPSGIFDQLTSLTDLDLGTNKLSSLPDGIFDKLTALTGTLYVDKNTYTTLPANIFANLTGINLLALSNTLTCLPVIPDSVSNDVFFDGQETSSLPACDAGVTVSSSSLSVGSSGSKTYTLVLAAPPNRFAGSGNNQGKVTITPSSSATGKATVAPASLTFTTSNWSTPQTVTVSGVATGSATVSHGISGGGYGSVTVDSLAVEVTTANLSTSNLAATTATLTLTGHTGNWYTKYTTPSGGTCSAVVSSGTTTAHLTGLTAGTSYSYKAYSDSGCTTANALASDTFLTKPGQVSGVTVAPGNTSLTVGWSALNGTVAGYKVQWKSGNDSYNTTTRQQSVATGGSTATLTGLVNGTAYTVRVSATNATGDGAASTEVTATPAGAALAATAVEDDTATLTMANHTGSWYYNYTVPTGGSCSAVVSSTTTTANLTGLDGNTRYTFKAYSDSSCTTALATAAAFLTKPGQPTQPTASAGAGSGKLTLAATVSGGSGALSKWQLSQDDGASWSDVTDTDNTLNTLLTGLSDGTSYTFRVRAVNSTGAGPASTASAATTPSAVTLSAGNVTHNTATLTLGNHSYSWYTQYTTPSGGSCSAVVSGGTTTANLTGLAGNTRYTFRVYGDSGCTAELAAVAVLTKPAQPSRPTVGTGARSGTLTLSATLSGGSGPLSKWQLSQDDGATWSDVTDTDNTLNTLLTGLTNGTTYSFKVRAVNSAGAGPASIASVATAPAAETLSASSVTHHTATLTLANYTGNWYYQYTAPTGGSCSAVVSSGVTTASLVSLSPATTYTFKAYSDSGCTTALATATAFLTRPAQVGGVTVAAANTSLQVSWTAGTGTVTDYKVQWKSGSDNYNTATRQQTVNSGTTTTITGLANSTTYTVRVIATNATGDGPASTASTATPAVLCGRTQAVQDAVVAAVPGKTTCQSVTAADLAAITGTLNLKGKGISRLKDGDFDGLSSLTALDLSGNSLSSLPAGIFDPLTALTTLNLSSNSLTTLPAASFAQLTNLTSLALLSNQLTSLPSGIFNPLTSLTDLDLGSNKLSSLADGIFDRLSALTGSLYIDNNAYTTLPAGILDNLTAVQKLRLSNTLTCLPLIPTAVTTNVFQGSDAPSAANLVACDAALTVSTTSLSVGASGSKTYTLVLAAPPNRYATSGNVTVTPSSSATGKATVAPATLTFTTSNWSTPQTVTVSGMAAGSATVSHAVSGGGYHSVTGPAVAVGVTTGNLNASNVAATTATLTLSGHTGNWYTNYTTPTGGTCSAVVSSGTTTTNLTGLAAATSYSFTAYSDSACTTANALASDTFLTKPGQVSGVTVAALSSSLQVRWSALNGTVAGYNVQWKSGNDSYNSTTRQQTVTNATTIITGLANTTSYTVRVTATNATGAGAPSADATGAPAGVALTATSVQATTATLTVAHHLTTWYYKYTVPSGDNSCTEVGAGTATASLTGLSAATSYTFKAYNDSSCSTELTSPTTDAELLTRPDQVSGVVVTTLNGSFKVGWSALNGTVAGYNVQWKSGSQDYNTTDRQTTVTSGTSAAAVTGLVNGTTYTLWVTATNATGGGASSTEVTATPGVVRLRSSAVAATTATLNVANYDGSWYYRKTAPTPAGTCSAAVAAGTTSASLTGLSAATTYTFKAYSDSACSTELTTATTDAEFLTRPEQVSGLAVTTLSGSLNVRWTPLTGTVTGYNVQWKSGTQGYNTTDRQTTVTSGTTASITGLTNATSYTVRVTAYNATGDGAASTEVTATPGAVRLSASAVDLTSATLTIANYQGSWYHKQTAPTPAGTCSVEIAAGTTTASLTGLTAGTSYSFKAYSDSSCNTELTTATTAADFATRPDQVSGVTVNTLGSDLQVSWTATTTATAYKVQWKSGTEEWDATNRQTTVTTTTATLTALSGTTTYTVRVAASNASGDGTWSATTTLLTTPAQVTGVTVTPATTSASWTAATGATGYKVQWKSGSEEWDATNRQTTVTTTAATLTALSSATTYTVRVAASNASGDGTWSATTTLLTMPGQVTGVTVTPWLGRLNVSWTAAASSYHVQWKSGTEEWDATNRQTTVATTITTLTALTAGTTYTVRVRGVNTTGNGAWSATVTGTPGQILLSSLRPGSVPEGGGAPPTRFIWAWRRPPT